MQLFRTKLITKTRISDYEREALCQKGQELSRLYVALDKMKQDLKTEETPIKRRYILELISIYNKMIDKYNQLLEEEQQKYEKSIDNLSDTKDNVVKTNNKLRGYIQYYKLKYENESNYIKKVSYKRLYEIYEKMLR